MAEATQNDLPRDLEDKVFPSRIQVPEIAHEVANAEKGLQDKALDMRTIVQASMEKKLSPEQAQRRLEMDREMASRPHAWEKIVDTEGNHAIISKFVRSDNSSESSTAEQLKQLEGLIISDFGPAILKAPVQRLFLKDYEDYGNFSPESLLAMVTAPGAVGKRYETADDLDNQQFMIIPVKVEDFGKLLKDKPHIVANLNRAENHFANKPPKPTSIPEIAPL